MCCQSPRLRSYPGNALPVLHSINDSDTTMNHILPALRTLALLSHRTQFPHYSAVQSCTYFQLPAVHTKTALPFLPATCSNTARPRISFCSRPLPAYRSGYRVKCRVHPHLLHTYSGYRLSQPVRYLILPTYGLTADWHTAVWKCRGPAIPERNCLFQKCSHSVLPLPFPSHTYHAQDSAAPPLQDMHLMR